jgi:hypothetical protein
MRPSPLLARRKVARRSDQEKWFIVMIGISYSDASKSSPSP